MSNPLGQMSVTQLKGVGPKMAEKLGDFGLRTVQDVLFHLPARYEDRTRVYNIADLYHGLYATVVATVLSADIKFGKRRSLMVKVADDSGTLSCRFFFFSAAQKKQLLPGTRVRLFGEMRRGLTGLEVVHPEYKILSEDEAISVAQSLTPVYPATDGIKQITLRNLTEAALQALDQGALAELFPTGLYQQQISLAEALHLVHRPPPDVALSLLEEGAHPAQQRLILEELIAHHLSILQVRQANGQDPSFVIPCGDSLSVQFLQTLPFSPTGAQQRVVEEIHADLKQGRPMLRLVQGDVGSGKTLVAALAALPVIAQGYQVALMAPTELLAEQHHKTLRSGLRHWALKWVGSRASSRARRASRCSAHLRLVRSICWSAPMRCFKKKSNMPIWLW